MEHVGTVPNMAPLQKQVSLIHLVYTGTQHYKAEQIIKTYRKHADCAMYLSCF